MYYNDLNSCFNSLFYSPKLMGRRYIVRVNNAQPILCFLQLSTKKKIRIKLWTRFNVTPGKGNSAE